MVGSSSSSAHLLQIGEILYRACPFNEEFQNKFLSFEKESKEHPGGVLFVFCIPPAGFNFNK